MLDNKRLGEVRGCLRKLPEQLVGGEHEWKHELQAAAMVKDRYGEPERGGVNGSR
jgi:hypothetical protein